MIGLETDIKQGKTSMKHIDGAGNRYETGEKLVAEQIRKEELRLCR